MLKFTVTGRSVHPCSFRGKEDILPIHYHYNQKDGPLPLRLMLVEEYLKEHDKKKADMHY